MVYAASNLLQNSRWGPSRGWPGSQTSSMEEDCVWCWCNALRNVQHCRRLLLEYISSGGGHCKRNLFITWSLLLILTRFFQLDPVYVLIIVFSGRVWDAITDPVVGYLTSLTKTRFGRLRPWLVVWIHTHTYTLVSLTRPLPPQRWIYCITSTPPSACWWCNTSSAAEGVVWSMRLTYTHAHPCTHTHTHHSCRMMMAALPAGVVYFLLWFVPPVFDERESYWKLIYYLLFYFAFQALLTVST